MIVTKLGESLARDLLHYITYEFIGAWINGKGVLYKEDLPKIEQAIAEVLAAEYERGRAKGKAETLSSIPDALEIAKWWENEVEHGEVDPEWTLGNWLKERLTSVTVA